MEMDIKNVLSVGRHTYAQGALHALRIVHGNLRSGDDVLVALEKHIRR